MVESSVIVNVWIKTGIFVGDTDQVVENKKEFESVRHLNAKLIGNSRVKNFIPFNEFIFQD
jgi:hypothetical protein